MMRCKGCGEPINPDRIGHIGPDDWHESCWNRAGVQAMEDRGLHDCSNIPNCDCGDEK